MRKAIVAKSMLIVLCVSFGLLPLFLIGCDKTVVDRDDVFVEIPSDSYTLYLSTESTFYIPADLSSLAPGTPVILRESPPGSELIYIEGQPFLKWSPRLKGQHKMKISNKENNFSQTYVLIVK